MDAIGDTKSRIEKDIGKFEVSVKQVERTQSNGRVIDLAKMYASDAKSYLDKGDFYTSFSCISYAHGLIDALKELANVR
jgi:hypothetical protein